jgi:hypothetical protein
MWFSGLPLHCSCQARTQFAMAGTFLFSPQSLVVETIPPDPVQGVSMNGWAFVSKPQIPYQRRFKVTLHGMRWIMNSDGTYDVTTTPNTNARALEVFYQAHLIWDNFLFGHPHLGNLTCRFATAVTVPASPARNAGFLDPLEIMLVEHQPAYS